MKKICSSCSNTYWKTEEMSELLRRVGFWIARNRPDLYLKTIKRLGLYNYELPTKTDLLFRLCQERYQYPHEFSDLLTAMKRCLRDLGLKWGILTRIQGNSNSGVIEKDNIL